MTNLISLKNDIANTLQNTNKKKSHSKFVTSSNILENSDFKSFLDLYLNNEADFFERIDGYDGFISTQQIESINYENFAEHVFFDSAVEKVNYAFSKAINDFPYDSTKYEYSQYLKKLDGFTRFVLKNKVKKSINYIHFDGNSLLQIKDKKGFLLNDYTGKSFINNFNPAGRNICLDFWLYPKNSSNETKSVCVLKKYANENGLIVTLDLIEDESFCNINFYVIDENESLKFTYRININDFQHICFEIKNIENEFQELTKEIVFYINGKEINKNAKNVGIIGNLKNLSLNFTGNQFVNEDLYIGCSNQKNITFESEEIDNIEFSSGFEGLIDEFKIFIGSTRSYEDILKYKNENENKKESLVLYLKFNEPQGLYSNNHIVLDYSGNKLHGEIKNVTSFDPVTVELYDDTFERNGKINNVSTPLIYELEEHNPILFSSFSHDEKLKMIEDASEYDLVNPNSFWKLFPKNIFLEGSDYDNIEKTYINTKTSKSSNLLGTERSINQELIKLISIWARFFDQIKMYIDSFTEILSFNYDTLNQGKKIDGMILPLALNQMGFKFRELQAFPISEKLDNKNLKYEEVMSVLSIRQIQNILWKRFLLNSKDYLMSKGTKKSIRSVFNSFGLEANKYISIKEINGQNNLNIKNQFIEDRKRLKFIDFNRHKKVFEGITFENSLPANRIFACTENLLNEKFNFENDWSIETYFRFDKNKAEMFDNNQSLLRIDRNLSGEGENFIFPFIDIAFKRINNHNISGDLSLNIRFDEESNESAKIENIEIFNGSIYHLCLIKSYDVITKEFVYKLQISPVGELSYVKELKCEVYTSNNYVDTEGVVNQYRVSIGNYEYGSTNHAYLTSFQGKFTCLRLYEDIIDDESLKIKKKDIHYIGFKKNITLKEIVNSDLQKIKLNIDMSQKIENVYPDVINPYNFVTTNDKILFKINVGSQILDLNSNISGNDIFAAEDHLVMHQSPEIDISENTNKVYINSLSSEYSKSQYNNSNISKTSQLHPEYLYHDDQRLYIDFSAVNFLNKDISKIISINNEFTQTLSNSSYLYEDDYKSLKQLSNLYFKRFKANEELNFSALYQIYKYFDNILEDLLHDAVPSRVNYLGFNFVYESHILERNKYQYKNRDTRISISSKEELKYQNYKNEENTVSYRYDDTVDFFGQSIIKKK